MSRNFRVMILLALAALAWTVTPAYSMVLTTYTDLASWQAATSGVQTITFTGNSPGTITTYNDATGVAYPDVQFIGIANIGYSLDVVDTTTFSWYSFGTGEALMQPMNRGASDPVPYIHVTFTTPVTAFGSDLFTYSSTGMSFGITVPGTPQYIVSTSATAPATFWGVTTDTPISSADFTLPGATSSGGSIAFLDNFRYGTAQAPTDTPEAATLVMIGSGLIGLAYMRKRIKGARPV